MTKASETIEINASPKDCYSVIMDFEKYPEFLKETKSANIEKKSGNTFVVSFTLDIIKKIHYTLKMVGKPSKKIQWTMVKSDLMKANSGGWVLEPSGNGTTKAIYSVDVDLGLFVPAPISKMLIGSNLPSMMKAFKKRIEGKKKR